MPSTVTRTAAVGGKRRFRLRFVLPLFSHRKKFRLLAFWLFWFCVCGYWLLSPSHGHLASMPDLANSLRYVCSEQWWEPETLETAVDVQISIIRLSKLTKRKSSWRLKTHCIGPLRSCIEMSLVYPKYLPQSPLDRPSQVTDRRKSVGCSQTFLRSFCPVKAKIGIVTRRGCWAEKMLVGVMLFCPQEEEKT